MQDCSNAGRKLKDNIIMNIYFTISSSVQMVPSFSGFPTISVFIFLAWLEIIDE